MLRSSVALLALVLFADVASACPGAGRLRGRVVSAVRHVERTRVLPRARIAAPAVVAVPYVVQPMRPGTMPAPLVK
jgi:hypothetical protein